MTKRASPWLSTLLYCPYRRFYVVVVFLAFPSVRAWRLWAPRGSMYYCTMSKHNKIVYTCEAVSVLVGVFFVFPAVPSEPVDNGATV